MQKLLSLVLTLLLAACASPAPTPTDNVIAPAFHRPEAGKLILLLPPEAETADMQPGIEILKQQLHKQLSAAGYKVALLDQASNNTIWTEEVAAVGGIYDPVTGNLRRPEYARAFSYLVQRVSGETKAVLVLRPRLVLRRALLAGQNATWDGQQRRVPVVGVGGGTTWNKGTTLGLSVELAAF
ncbi:MAG: hypothetical protein V4451_21265, partial [Pseudomonadota bacterium]